MTSCMILSCDKVRVEKPARLAGTCSRYSNSAIPQLTSAATYQGRSLRFLRWAYHAKVMKTLEQTRRPAVTTKTLMAGVVGQAPSQTPLLGPPGGRARRNPPGQPAPPGGRAGGAGGPGGI